MNAKFHEVRRVGSLPLSPPQDSAMDYTQTMTPMEFGEWNARPMVPHDTLRDNEKIVPEVQESLSSHGRLF
ncbi:hypothetical protein P3T76_012148 [Phytophthora citrophthora]|uniref:Uncharacterized protein n=1 Tax=Phytophthora citrophthora TaxID=4793 RepID=A0AAD9G6A9_9STRA|nr:hypothetical protein P3T76_012148 [Phytophthora citrophthora]